MVKPKHTRDVAAIAGLVYFVQGAIGIAGIALPLFLRGMGWTVAQITAVSSIAAAPWVLKIFYGLLSDSFPLFGYRRKSYLTLCAFISALGWFLLVILPSNKQWILLSLVISNLGFAATDVITDGLIVEHSTKVTSHIYQSIAWGSRSFGALVSGVIGGWLAAHWRPQEVFLLTMLLPLTVLVSVIWSLEKKISRPPFRSALAPVQKCIGLLATPNLMVFMAILVFASISASFGVPFFFFMKESLGFDELFLGWLASVGWGGAMLGSLVYARWLRHASPKTTLRWAILVNSINILSTLFIMDGTSAFVLVFIGGIMGCLTLLPIMSSAAILTHHTGVEGTLFAVLMSIFNLGQVFFGFIGGRIFEKIGLYPLIGMTGVLALTGLLFVERLSFEHGNPAPAS